MIRTVPWWQFVRARTTSQRVDITTAGTLAYANVHARAHTLILLLWMESNLTNSGRVLSARTAGASNGNLQVSVHTSSPTFGFSSFLRCNTGVNDSNMVSGNNTWTPETPTLLAVTFDGTTGGTNDRSLFSTASGIWNPVTETAYDTDDQPVGTVFTGGSDPWQINDISTSGLGTAGCHYGLVAVYQADLGLRGIENVRRQILRGQIPIHPNLLACWMPVGHAWVDAIGQHPPTAQGLVEPSDIRLMPNVLPRKRAYLWWLGGGAPVAKAASDSWGWSESVSETGAYSESDTGGWAESPSDLSRGISDPGGGDDSISQTAAYDASDTGGWDDSAAAAQAFTSSDTWGWSESVSETASINPSDTGAWAESPSDFTRGIGDTGGSADTDSLAAAFSVSDTGAWAEIAAAAQLFTITDTGGFSDSLTTAVTLTVSDTGALNDVLSAFVRSGILDTASWTESASKTVSSTFVGSVIGSTSVVVRMQASGNAVKRIQVAAKVLERLFGSGGSTPG